MPSRNRMEKACEPASLSPRDTGPTWWADFSDMVRLTLPTALPTARGSVKPRGGQIDELVVAKPGPVHLPRNGKKKSRRCRRLKVITGRRQTEWTGATRCPEVGR